MSEQHCSSDDDGENDVEDYDDGELMSVIEDDPDYGDDDDDAIANPKPNPDHLSSSSSSSTEHSPLPSPFLTPPSRLLLLLLILLIAITQKKVSCYRGRFAGQQNARRTETANRKAVLAKIHCPAFCI